MRTEAKAGCIRAACAGERGTFFLRYLASVILMVVPATVFAQSVVIDAAWLASRQPPYRLTGTGSTYLLATDVTVPGTAFLFRDDNIVFDLGGHTITYADMDFTGMHNGGFELPAPGNPNVPDGWDLSAAPHARRQNYLEKLYFDDWSLRLENPAGDSLHEEYVRSPEVYLPAPGKYAAIAQVRGGPYNAVRVTMAIEGISVTPDNLISNMPMVYQGTDMSIGIIAEFNVDAPCSVRVRVILGTADPAVSTTADIDEVDVRPIGMYGVALEGWNRRLSEIRNGTIREGRSQAIYSHALHRTGARKIHHLTLITNGVNSMNISEAWAGGLEIHDNRLEALAKLPLHRHYPFSMIDLSQTPGGNDIYGNTLLYGPHVGINHGNATGESDNPSRSRIHDNVIRTRITATNGFAISIGSNVEVYANTIQPFQGHGIGIGTGSNNVSIHDNLIEPSTWPCSEYSSYGYPNSAHGIRIKTYGSGKLHDVEIYNNRITGRTNPQKSNCYTEVVGITNYVTDSDPAAEPNPSNISIHANFVEVTTDDYLHQHAIAYKVGPHGSVSGNQFASNHIIVEMSDADAGVGQNSTMISNAFRKLPNPSGFHTMRFGYNRPYGNVLLDTTLLDGADLKDILQTRTYSPPTDLTVAWYLTVKVRNAQNAPVSGATVSVRDSAGATAGTMTTGSSGEVRFELPEYIYTYDSDAKYDYKSPYRIEVSASGYQPVSRTVSLDRSMELVVVSGSSVQPPLSPRKLRIP